MKELVCINNDGCPSLKLHKKYIIIREIDWLYDVKGIVVLKGDGYYYSRDKFITISEFRMKKIKKITNNIDY